MRSPNRIVDLVKLWYLDLTELDVSEDSAVRFAEDGGHRADKRMVDVTTLLPNTRYRFRVRAVNSYGRGTQASSPSGNLTNLALLYTIKLGQTVCILKATETRSYAHTIQHIFQTYI